MRKLVSVLLVLSLLFTASAMASLSYDFPLFLGNEATFETLEEARASESAVVEAIPVSPNNGYKNFKPHTVLNDFPANTAFVYRSPDMYCGYAGSRMNSTFVVYVDQIFADKAAAFDFIQGIGLVDVINEMHGSIVLVTPSSERGFSAADQTHYYHLQTAICAQKSRGTIDGESVIFADGDYYGTFHGLYLIGIDGGATFLNNYVAGTENFIGRVAGMLLVNGKMNPLSPVASLVPTYLVNADDMTIAKYQKANGVNAYEVDGDVDVHFDQYFPLRKVVVAQADDVDVAAFVKDAHQKIFKGTMRIQVYKNGYLTAGTPYQNTTGDCAPYSLCHRCEIIDGRTEGGVYVNTVNDLEQFKHIQTTDGEYIKTWHEILPAGVVEGTAAPGSVPLILGLAGTGDDPFQFAFEAGLVHLAEEKGVAIVAPGHEGIFETLAHDDGVEYTAQPALIQYMLDKYPALDATRVYATGYSRGGRTTMKVIMGAPEMLAAAVPMAANQFFVTDEQLAHLYETKIPTMFLTSTADAGSLFDANNYCLAEGLRSLMDTFAGFNKVEPIGPLDTETYPISGFKGDIEIHKILNGEYLNHRYFRCDADGVPMVGLSITEGLQHALYPEYGFLAWDYMEHFSRNPETYEITYTPW